MTIVYALRHPETDWNRERRFHGRVDVPLSVNGRQQAAEMAEFFRTIRLTHIVSGPLQRSFEQANRIAAFHSLAVVVDAVYTERNMGTYEGKHYSEHPSGPLAALKSELIEGGESLGDVYRRVAQWPQKLVAYGEDAQITLISHGGPLAMLPTVLGGKPYDPATAVLLKNGAYHRFELDPSGKPLEVRLNCSGPSSALETATPTRIR